jgi:hypothetical protein
VEYSPLKAIPNIKKKSRIRGRKINFPTAILNIDYESYKVYTILEVSLSYLLCLIFNISMELPNHIREPGNHI